MKQFTLTINKTGLKAQGNLEIPTGFIYKGIVSGYSFNTAPIGVGFSGEFFTDANSDEAIIIKNGLQQGPRGVHAQVGGLINSEGVLTQNADELTATLDFTLFLAGVKEQIATKLGCEITDID